MKVKSLPIPTPKATKPASTTQWISLHIRDDGNDCIDTDLQFHDTKPAAADLLAVDPGWFPAALVEVTL